MTVSQTGCWPGTPPRPTMEIPKLCDSTQRWIRATLSSSEPLSTSTTSLARGDASSNEARHEIVSPGLFQFTTITPTRISIAGSCGCFANYLPHTVELDCRACAPGYGPPKHVRANELTGKSTRVFEL